MRSQLTDEVLARLAAERHKGAFDQLYERHAPRVFARLTRMLGNSADCEDVMHESFLGLHKALPSFRHDSRFSTFLYGIVHNKAKDRLKKRRRWSSEVAVDAEALAALAATVEDPAERAFAASSLARLFPLLDQLKPRQRIALTLIRIEGLSYKEAAAELGVSEHTLRQRVSKALQQLTKLLERPPRSPHLPRRPR